MGTSDRALANASKRNVSHRHHRKQRARRHQTRRLLLEGLEARHLLAATWWGFRPPGSPAKGKTSSLPE